MRLLLLASAVVIGLATGCVETSSPLPTATPDRVNAATPEGRSAAVRRHYEGLQAQHLRSGLLRTDGGATDSTISASLLEETFVRIALYDEYSVERGRYVARQRPAQLRRWQEPVRVGLTFGADVPAAQRARDRASVEALVAQLGAATGHSIRLDADRANLHVQILSEDDRSRAAPRWAALLSGVPEAILTPAAEIGLETVCLALGFMQADSMVYAQAMVIVRAELPDLLRLSCLHEEMAQALGLVNDWPGARPSIFNDDEEFATLTRLDLLLLRILYDPRLTPGLREAEARPIIAAIAAEIMAETSVAPGAAAEGQAARAP